jgi:hypothetical protein
MACFSPLVNCICIKFGDYVSQDIMPKRANKAPARPAPIQLPPLFVEAASLVRIRPALHERRYDRVEIWPDLFGRALLVRQWPPSAPPAIAGSARIPIPVRRSLVAAAALGTENVGKGIGPRQVKPRRHPPAHIANLPGRSRRPRVRLPASRTVQSIASPQSAAARPPPPAPQTGMRLHAGDGSRKYLTAGERDRFQRTTEQAERPVWPLCMTFAYAGCRLSEALALTVDRVDMAACVLVFESLKKKRRTGIFRSVSVPPALLDAARKRWRSPPSEPVVIPDDELPFQPSIAKGTSSKRDHRPRSLLQPLTIRRDDRSAPLRRCRPKSTRRQKTTDPQRR